MIFNISNNSFIVQCDMHITVSPYDVIQPLPNDLIEVGM